MAETQEPDSDALARPSKTGGLAPRAALAAGLAALIGPAAFLTLGPLGYVALLVILAAQPLAIATSALTFAKVVRSENPQQGRSATAYYLLLAAGCAVAELILLPGAAPGFAVGAFLAEPTLAAICALGALLLTAPSQHTRSVKLGILVTAVALVTSGMVVENMQQRRKIEQADPAHPWHRIDFPIYKADVLPGGWQRTDVAAYEPSRSIFDAPTVAVTLTIGGYRAMNTDKLVLNEVRTNKQTPVETRLSKCTIREGASDQSIAVGCEPVFTAAGHPVYWSPEINQFVTQFGETLIWIDLQVNRPTAEQNAELTKTVISALSPTTIREVTCGRDSNDQCADNGYAE